MASDAAAFAAAALPGDRLFCRSQVKRIEGNGVRHPLQALLEMIE